jgi:Cof subfamily protein (haloacid dehalogenase superfamily)
MTMQNTPWPDIAYQNFQMIVSDLDGTLKDIDSALDPELTGIIAGLERNGIHFTIATGKNLKSTRETALALGIDMPIVFSNGCMVQKIDGTILEKEVLPIDFVRSLITVCDQQGIELAIHIGEDIYVCEITHNASLLFDYGSPSLEVVGAWAQVEDLLPQAYKCIALERDDRQRLFDLEEKVYAIAGDRVEYCHTLVEMLEFMPRGISKVSGIRALGLMYGVPMEAILTMGDGNNDIGMLQTAGYSVAVANAPDAVRAAARWIIPSCAENGPKEFLRHVLNTRQAV